MSELLIIYFVWLLQNRFLEWSTSLVVIFNVQKRSETEEKEGL
jgi:hypothetical protein